MNPGYNTWDRRQPGAALLGTDPDIAALIAEETRRQSEGIELIASENFVSPAVLEAMGSTLTNKYAEGLPGKRYYGGCEVVDKVEQLAIDRAKQLFGADHANVQPHSGATANAAVFLAFLKPGETVMGLDLSQGGHLTHGSPVNFSGLNYRAVHYGVNDEGLIDYPAMRELARRERPKMIIAGYSAYSRYLDYQQFADAAKEVGAIFMVDMAHFAGLVAAGEHPNPVPYADVATTTIHKTLCGPRSGMILCKEELAKDMDRSVFPGTQGGPLMHIIAAKAVALAIAQSEPFRARQRQTIANAKAFAEALIAAGIEVLTGGTDVHLVLVDLGPTGLDGKTAESRLEEVGITVNRNAIPFDERPPMNPSGLRIGTPALTTRGLTEDDMGEIAEVISVALSDRFEKERDSLAERTQALMEQYPLYPELSAAPA
jgi:glycine hydroxymethyltransferase